jgi:hypothetical protein
LYKNPCNQRNLRIFFIFRPLNLLTVRPDPAAFFVVIDLPMAFIIHRPRTRLRGGGPWRGGGWLMGQKILKKEKIEININI